MIQVGAKGGVLLLVPMSSSIMTRMYSQLAALALTWPSLKRSTIKLAVLPYQDWPGLILCVGKKAGQVALTAPSAWYCSVVPMGF